MTSAFGGVGLIGWMEIGDHWASHDQAERIDHTGGGGHRLVPARRAGLSAHRRWLGGVCDSTS